MLKTILSITASFLCLVAFFPYISSIIRGTTKPNRASWWIWVTLGTVLCASYYSTGGGITLWAFVFTIIGQLIVAILSLKSGEGGWSNLDRTCLIGAGVSLLLWLWFDDPFVALLFGITIDVFAVIPTIKKSYLDPESEDLLYWELYGLGTLINIFTVENWSIQVIIWPLYVLAANIAIVWLLLIPKFNRPIA
jgi:hypothetical protein